MSGHRCWRRLVVLAASGLLTVSGYAPPAPAPAARVIDLLQQDWEHVPGVAADRDGLRITATGRSIVHRGGGARQPDPPVDLAGTHLVNRGGFSLGARLTDVTADATLAVYDSPPVIADEFGSNRPVCASPCAVAISR